MEADEADSLIDTDEGRRRAIRAAMEAGGHAEETILDALASLGLKSRWDCRIETRWKNRI